MFDFHSRTATPFLSLSSEEELTDAVLRSNGEPIILFKHSATCGISAGANSSMAELSEATDPPIYRLIVQESRGLSNTIAERFEVRHESPQVLVLVEGEVVFHTSHYRITAERLRDTVKRLAA
ncbi:MAG: bacillithiol system redox-active protein YtxJ [Rhodothermales bacterium]